MLPRTSLGWKCHEFSSLRPIDFPPPSPSRGRVSSARDINQEVLQRKSFIYKRYQSGSSSEEEFHLQEMPIRKFFRRRVSSARDINQEVLRRKRLVCQRYQSALFFRGRALSARDLSQRRSPEDEHSLQEPRRFCEIQRLMPRSWEMPSMELNVRSICLASL